MESITLSSDQQQQIESGEVYYISSEDFATAVASEFSVQQNQAQLSTDDEGNIVGKQVFGENQEVFVYDTETGEYQKCIYLPHDLETQDAASNEVITGDSIDVQYLIDEGVISSNETIETENSEQPSESSQSQEENAEEEAIVLQTAEEGEESQQIIIDAGAHQFIQDENGELTIVIPEGSQAEDVITNDENVNQDNNQIQLEIPCPKCEHRASSQEELATHYNEAHLLVRICAICQARLSKRDYLVHFKEHHSDVRLGCPKCPQTYHSPELLNVHFKHIHLNKKRKNNDEDEDFQQSEDGKVTIKNVRMLMKCKVCDQVVNNIQQHMSKEHPSDPNPSVKSKNKTSMSSSPKHTRPNSPQLEAKKRRKSPGPQLQSCNVCLKMFASQRDFSNHRRRKGFCKPPATPPPPQKRRIGIIRKSL